MEISSRHLQEVEQQEMRDHLAEALGRDPGKVTIQTAESQERAEAMQRQVDGLTRNQRRVLNKRMAKAARKGK